MASTKSTARKPKSQPSTKQTHEQWHEDRYGEHRDQLSDEQLKQLVEEICGKNYDEEAAAALVLLMDEFERSQFDRMHVASITITVSTAAFQYTTDRSTAEKNLVATRRRELARKELVN